MAENESDAQDRVSKREFVSRVSKRTGIPVRVVNQVYEGAVEELIDVVKGGARLTLTGFGKFYPQEHKGHKVRFSESGEDSIGDYHVLKFSATRDINRRIGGESVD